MSRPAICEIDLAALQHNFDLIKILAPQSKRLAMVKANAYGHGLVEVARVLTDADALGVACIEEAIVLRAASIKTPIVLMEGFFTVDELSTIYDKQFEIVIHYREQLEQLLTNPPKYPINLWIKINTGMNRLGFLPEDITYVIQKLQNQAWLKQLRWLTHFADADDLNKTTMAQQVKKFNEVTARLPGEKSLANSAALLGWPATHADWVRAGIMLYGVSPFAGHSGLEHGLKPVMTLRSAVIAIQSLRKGDAVGYGGTWICPEDMQIGIVALGYGDGYPRSVKSATPVLLNNQHVQLIGRVSMDMLAVDLRTQPAAKIGDPVVFWGKGFPIEIKAQYSEKFVYELLCGVTQRVPRVYLK